MSTVRSREQVYIAQRPFLLIFIAEFMSFMAARFETQSKGWQGYTARPIGGLRQINCEYGAALGRYKERIKSFTDDDECIYYSIVHSKDHKLKMITNPGYGRFTDVDSKAKAADGYNNNAKATKLEKLGERDEGIYEVLRCTTTERPISQAPHRTALGSSRNPHAPVPMSRLRALKNDLVAQQNTTTSGRVLTFEPQGYRTYESPEYASINRHDEKAKLAGPNGFVSQQSSHSLIVHEDSDELLDYCTCMCAVKGAFYHFTKDSLDEGRASDQPCSCAGPLRECLPRWGCLSLFALFLPCLCCYPPLKGCRRLNNHVNGLETKAIKKKENK